MPTAVVVVYWCWFAVSIAILLGRLFRKASRHPKRSGSRPVAPIAPVASPAATVPDTARPERADPGRSCEGGAAATLGDALRGIRMPCDLMPLAGGDEIARRAAFVTVGHPAEAVAPKVASEIERLGLAYRRTTDTTAVAERDDVRVTIAVRQVGASLGGVADPLYPTAPAHSVIVEFELATSS